MSKFNVFIVFFVLCSLSIYYCFVAGKHVLSRVESYSVKLKLC
jgi:hypothetical protein